MKKKLLSYLINLSLLVIMFLLVILYHTEISTTIDIFVAFLKGQIFSFVILYILIFIVILYIKHLANKNYFDPKGIMTQYDPPKNISPVFARYLLTGGRLGRMAGEISISGLQTIMLIDLYENGGLSDLTFIDQYTVKYTIDSEYKDKKLNHEQLKFIEYLHEYIGGNSIIKRDANSKSNQIDNGFKEINNFWNIFWNKDLNNLAIERGYVLKNSILDYFISWFTVSLTFGIFFSVFLMFIPIIGYILILIILLPILLLFGLSVLINMFLLNFFDTNQIFNLLSNTDSGEAVLIILPFIIFISWITFFFLLGNSTKRAMTKITPSGKDIIWHINGYKSFLKKTDKDRLTFSLNKDLEEVRNNSSFAWLAIFKIVKDEHWDQLRELHKGI